MEDTESHAHVESMDSLGLGDGEFAKSVMFLGLTLYVILVRQSVVAIDLTQLARLTPIGFAAVRMTSERSLKVRDIVRNDC